MGQGINNIRLNSESRKQHNEQLIRVLALNNSIIKQYNINEMKNNEERRFNEN